MLNLIPKHKVMVWLQKTQDNSMKISTVDLVTPDFLSVTTEAPCWNSHLASVNSNSKSLL